MKQREYVIVCHFFKADDWGKGEEYQYFTVFATSRKEAYDKAKDRIYSYQMANRFKHFKVQIREVCNPEEE